MSDILAYCTLYGIPPRPELADTLRVVDGYIKNDIAARAKQRAKIGQRNA